MAFHYPKAICSFARTPYVNRAVELLHCSLPAAAKAMRVLEAAGILHALDDRKKKRAVVFKAYLDDLREGTEL